MRDVVNDKEIKVRAIRRQGDLAGAGEKPGCEVRRVEEMQGPLRAVP